ncbi:MAG: hypothetical protein ACRDIF_01465, partial [Actinomycetota bacterium]
MGRLGRTSVSPAGGVLRFFLRRERSRPGDPGLALAGLAVLVVGALLVAGGPASAVSLTFVPATDSPYGAGTAPAAIAYGEFNTGVPPFQLDMAVANSGSNNVTIFLGDNTNKKFTVTGSPIPVGTNPRGIVAQGFDFAVDTHVDLAVANSGSDNVTILKGDGTGGFPTSSTITVGSDPRAIAVGSFDSNSQNNLFFDLAVANFGSDNITILLSNAGNGTFTASTLSLPINADPTALLAFDLDFDNDTDLAVANSGTDNVSMFLSNGDGTFAQAPGSPFAAGDGPSGIVSNQFDNDALGNLDLAVLNRNSNNVSIFLGNGTGLFAPLGSPISVGASPSSIDVSSFESG